MTELCINAINIIQATFYSEGNGSYVIHNGTEKRMHTKVSERGVTIFGIPYDRSKTDKILNIAKEYLSQSADLKRIGPASLDICKVASGKANNYVELDLKEWDIAAGILILTEAGGKYERKKDLHIFKA